jgi:hypothetical protein
MKLLMESTEYVVKVGGVECRVWNGVTEQDTQVFVLVHRLLVRESDDQEEFATLCERSKIAVEVIAKARE